MKIRVLDRLPLIDEPATVIVTSEEFAVDLSDFESGSVFYREARFPFPKSGPVVVVNPTVELLDSLIDQVVGRQISGMELWADASGVAEFWKCTQCFDELAISQASISESWIRVRVEPSIEGDRSAKDFSFGLGAAQIAIGSAVISSAPTSLHTLDDTATAKAELIRVAAKLMKPMKPYLPRQLVHALYRVLGAVR